MPQKLRKTRKMRGSRTHGYGQIGQHRKGGGKGGGRGGRTPNDDRSDSMNPNNPAYQASLDNRSDQLNPNNPEYRGDDEEDAEEE